MGSYRQIAQTIITLVLLTLMLVGCQKPDRPVEKPNIIHLPDISLTSMEGNRVSLRSLQGQILVLNIWATWCPGCRAEMPSLERLSKELAGQNISIVGVTIDQDVLLAKEFMRQTAVTFQNFSDPQGQVAQALGVTVYPETLIVDKDGTILYRVFGAIDWHTQDIKQALLDLADGKHPALKNKLTH